MTSHEKGKVGRALLALSKVGKNFRKSIVLSPLTSAYSASRRFKKLLLNRPGAESTEREDEEFLPEPKFYEPS
ncbi:hypothetical protein WA1_13060 [Scytonema hofmannii PCC 7110]|uniref:Uncharacterized protein n=1 Tax=Scytonema hofmannii PCC 7110 TaxID=128403 RepID=A0A139XE99_9CYAN|nr:hypothetical protein WA1_13060 [Scytonema hofmannii PCC 7110]